MGRPGYWENLEIRNYWELREKTDQSRISDCSRKRGWGRRNPSWKVRERLKWRTQEVPLPVSIIHAISPAPRWSTPLWVLGSNPCSIAPETRISQSCSRARRSTSRCSSKWPWRTWRHWAFAAPGRSDWPWILSNWPSNSSDFISCRISANFKLFYVMWIWICMWDFNKCLMWSWIIFARWLGLGIGTLFLI